MRSKSFTLAGALACLVLGALLVSGVVGAGAAPTTKYYAAGISAPAPAEVFAGATKNVTLTLTNCGPSSGCKKASTQPLGSANLTFDAGFTLAATSVSAPGGKQWTASISGSTLQLRNPGPNTTNALAPGETLSVTVSTTAPTTPGTYPVVSEIKQSNDFNGAGNDFVNASTDPSIVVLPPESAVAKIVFTNQPALAEVGAPIDDPSGVKVQLLDTQNNPVSGATATLALDPTAPGTGALAGTLAHLSDASGVASFPGLDIDTIGIYRLEATSGAVTQLSAPFVIATDVSTCTVSCGGSSSSTKNTTTSVAATGTTADQQLGIALFSDSAPPEGACDGFTPRGDGSLVVFNKTVEGQEPSLVVTWTLDKTQVQKQTDRGAAHVDICLGSIRLDGVDEPFTTKDGVTPAVGIYDGVFGVTRYWGILANCGAAPTEPCVLSRTKTGAGDIVVTIDLPYPWDPIFWGG